MKSKLLIILIILTFSFSFIGCKKLLEVEAPNTSVNSSNIYEKDITAASVLTGIYTKMSSIGLQQGSLPGISYYSSLSSDELSFSGELNDQVANNYFTNSLTTNGASVDFWVNIYRNLYVINSALEGVSNSETLSPEVKRQLLGESKFMRAFCYFYLVNLYGDVPLVLGTDYKINALVPRSPKTDIWKQIILDLTDAKTLLSSTYLDATLLNDSEERVRPTKWAASALLARTYLYTKDWAKAELESTNVIESPLFKLVELDRTFKKNNDEAIWQLQPVYKGYNTQEGEVFNIRNIYDLGNRPLISQSLLDEFEVGDLRKVNWVNSIDVGGITYYYAYKYKVFNTGNLDIPVSEYSTILRLAEMFLIRGEAKIQQARISDGIADLNNLRLRATDKTLDLNLQLKPLPIDLSQNKALEAVEHERRVELFTEWGHRWLDLKRTDKVDDVMTIAVPKKGNGKVWKSYQQLYPINQVELKNNPRLIQNVGY